MTIKKEMLDAFPECEKLKKEDMADALDKIFSGLESYNQVWSIVEDVVDKKNKFPTDEKEKHEAYFAWRNKYYNWIHDLKNAYIQEFGVKRSFEDACSMAADEWIRLIFDNGVQDNGDRSGYSDGLQCLGTYLKKSSIDRIGGEEGLEKIKENVRQKMYEYYLGGCRYTSNGGYTHSNVSPYCDYDPNMPLYDILNSAGIPEQDIFSICPWKTGVEVDTLDNSVIVSTYGKRKYK